MDKKIFYYFKICAEMARKGEERHFLLGSVGIRNDGAMVKSFNMPSEKPNRLCHAEYRLCKKLDMFAPEIYVARIRLDSNGFGMSAPCENCRKVIASKKVSKVYYTINDSKYGIWNVDKDSHIIKNLNV